MIDFKKSYSLLGEYVGTNQPFEMDESMMALVSSFTRVQTYPILYRVWAYLNVQEVVAAIKEGNPFRVHPARAFAKSYEAAKEVHADIYYGGGSKELPLTTDEKEAVLVTRHKGLYGFEPIEILKKGLAAGLAGDEEQWARDIIKDYGHQQEVYSFEAVTEIRKENLYKALLIV